MRPLTEIFNQKKRTFSFELFPPKTPEGYKRLLSTIERLALLQPDFISVTYGAGGGNREKTLDIVEHIQTRHKITGVAHLTCVRHTKKEIARIVNDIRQRGIRNILALRGDPPREDPDWQPTEVNFRFSYELTRFIHDNHPGQFAVGVAGFPEGHVLCPDKDLDARYLKMKIDAGADYVITQLFFDNRDYFDYVGRLRNLGVEKRIIPGIVPITDFKGIVKFCRSCGATIPSKMRSIFEPIQDDKEAVMQAGIDYCREQCRQLLAGGAPGIHFYALNKSHPVDVILPALRQLP